MSTIDRRTLRRARHVLCQTWRAHLINVGAIEVTTPVLHPFPDIAPVRQFTTAHPSTGAQFCLRIAPTEQLKQMLADGEQRIFEFSANFRDDLRDRTHLSEFMSLEYMAVGATCADMEATAVELCRQASAALANLTVDGPPEWVRQLHDGRFRRVSVADLPGISAGGSNIDEVDRSVTEHASGVGGLVLMGDFPYELGGPAEAHVDRPGFKQRTEIYVDGLEIANMSTTLTDPTLLGAWHAAGLVRKAALGITPNERDSKLFEAVSNGIPKSAVIGMGIERFLQAYFGLEKISQEIYNGH